ncbi:MAG: hypothetical protein RIA69_12980, partial [Cyclobacteriaceae bacterium]
HPLYRVERQWKKGVLWKILAWLALWLTFVALYSWIAGFSYLLLIVSVVISTLLLVKEWYKMPSIDQVVKLVNVQFEPTEFSTELLFDKGAVGLQAVQRNRVIKALNQEIPHFKFPIYWKDWSSLAVFMAIVLAIITVIERQTSIVNNDKTAYSIDNSPLVEFTDSDTVFLKQATVTVKPPSYTGLSASTLTNLNVQFPEGSRVSWNLSFEGNPDLIWIKTSMGDSVVYGSGNGLQLRPKESGFYSIHFKIDSGRVVSSPYYELRQQLDEPPVVSVDDFPQFQRLDYSQGITFNVPIQFSDDYGLTDGYLVATITKGAGESVRFREQKITFDQPLSGKEATRTWEVNLDALEMEPGNELYFYATAFDNKPQRQQSRTETFFIILADTAQAEFSLQGALGVDLMPDFFRSQLQIIMDTEKLIREKKQMTVKEFDFKSNELGFDQKKLRLKYGQFIGEEEDSGLDIDSGEDHEEVSHTGENVLEEFGHDTDHENEEGQWMDRGTEADNKNPLADYMHTHDDEETATFYTQTIKDKLRAALNEMWDAELYLRLFQPKESLPYQYRAQELLKEIRNHARIYVQRIGFEPPPVNEVESRLTGKLKEVNQRPFQSEREFKQDYPAIRKAIVRLDQVSVSGKWDQNAKQVLQSAGDELAGLAITQPGKYLEALNTMRLLLDKNSLSTDDLRKLNELKATLEVALTVISPMPTATERTDDEMSRHFLMTLLNPEQP